MDDPSDDTHGVSVDARLIGDLDAAWHAHAEEVRRRCIVWMGGRADEAGEAFSRAWSRAAANYIASRPTLQDRRAWLLTLAYRACMDLHRERARRGEEVLLPPDSRGSSHLQYFTAAGPRDPEGLALGRELMAVLLAAIDELPLRLREAMRTYIHTGDYREVVERLGITNENARKRIQQGRAILRKKLLDYRAGRHPAPRARRRRR
jgi:RNA polymerase sigma-70 factor (ECF subfamily)